MQFQPTKPFKPLPVYARRRPTPGTYLRLNPKLFLSSLLLCVFALSGCASRYESEAHAKMVHARDVSKYQQRMDRSEHELAWWEMKRDLAEFNYRESWGYLATTNMETNRLLFHASFDRFIADEQRLWMLEDPASYHAYMDSRTNRSK